MEEWRDIGFVKGTDFTGLYMVSSEGNVKALERDMYGVCYNGTPYHYHSPERVLVLNKLRSGYVYVDLCNNGIKIRELVHRLVAKLFIPNPDNLPYVNHKNRITDDNRVKNLEWCTPQYNVNYDGAHERAMDVLSERKAYKIVQLDLDGNIVKIWDSIRKATRVGFSDSCIRACISGRCKTHKGYIWKKLDDFENIS